MSDRAEMHRQFKSRGGIADLSDRLKLRLSGEDRVRYLNGQVSSNVQRLHPGQAQPACVTTAKGRLCGDAFLHASGDALFLDADASLRESLPPRLERYIVADDVILEDVTDDLHLVHLLGDLAPASDLADAAALVDRAHRFGRDGWDVLLSREAFAAYLPRLAERVPLLDAELQETLRIEAGVPRWGRELDETTLPPEAGLDRTHIDYHKGCYLGQEVISRLRSVGHVNRELTGFIAPLDAAVAAGMQLFAPDGGGKPLGALTSVGFSFALEKPIALGYLRRGAGFPEVIARSAEAAGFEITLTVHALPLVS